MVEVEWVENMPVRERVARVQKYDWHAVARALRERPGKWALVAKDVPRSTAAAIKRGERVAFQPPEDWLVTTSGPAGSRGDLYMAYIGAPGARLTAEKEAENAGLRRA